MVATNDLATDRRIQRHARTLYAAGRDVVLIGRNEVHPRARRGWLFYAEFNLRLAFFLLRKSKKRGAESKEVVWCNDVDALPGAWLAARLRGSRLVLDCHEIFPELPEVQGRSGVKRVWRLVERLLIPRSDAALTVCQSLADHYREALGVEMTVVRNMPEEWAAGSGQWSVGSGHPMLLYQGCVNVGRGVDWAIDALEYLPDCRLVVAGGGDLLEEMRAYAAEKPWSERIELMGRVSVEELPNLTRQADVGLVMLEDMGLSYHLALPNRIGDFIAARVPMVVSDLPEMAAVVRRYAIGSVMAAPGPKPLANAIKQVLQRPRQAWDFSAAQADFDWRHEKQKLLKIITQKL